MNDSDRIIGTMGEYSVIIINNDTGVPHIHVVNEESGFDSAIQLLDNKYMPDTKYTLTNEECMYFNTWIKQYQEYGHLKIQNWEKALFYWQTITNNCDIELPKNRIIPDYSKLRSDM